MGHNCQGKIAETVQVAEDLAYKPYSRDIKPEEKGTYHRKCTIYFTVRPIGNTKGAKGNNINNRPYDVL